MFLSDIKHDWIGEIPSNWKKQRIKDIFHLTKNVSEDPESENVLSLTMRGIVKRDISSNEGQLPETYLGYTKLFLNDITMNPMDLKSGWVDKSKYEGIISPSYFVLNRNNEDMDIQYFTYQLQRYYKEKIFFPFGQGVSYEYRWGLSKDTLLNFPIIVPPVQEQQQISDYLDYKISKIDSLIDNTEQKIKLLNEQRIKLINSSVTLGLDSQIEMKDSSVKWIGKIPFGWTVKKLKYLSEILPSNVDKHIYSDEIQVNLCNYTDVYYNELIDKNTKLSKGSCNQMEFDKFSLRKGDVIVTKDSESADDIGIPTEIKEDLPGVVCGYHLTLIRPLDLFGGYLFRFIQSERTRRYFEVNTDGVTRFGLGKPTIQNMYIPIPPFEEQQQIADYLDKETSKIDKHINKESKRIKLLKEYRQSLISNVVTGKVDVRNKVLS